MWQLSAKSHARELEGRGRDVLDPAGDFSSCASDRESRCGVRGPPIDNDVPPSSLFKGESVALFGAFATCAQLRWQICSASRD